MNPLLFHCPETGREIETGIEINYSNLRNVQPVTVRLMCPLCGQLHEWKLSEGFIREPPAAEPPKPLEPPELAAWSPCR